MLFLFGPLQLWCHQLAGYLFVLSMCVCVRGCEWGELAVLLRGRKKYVCEALRPKIYYYEALKDKFYRFFESSTGSRPIHGSHRPGLRLCECPHIRDLCRSIVASGGQCVWNSWGKKTNIVHVRFLVLLLACLGSREIRWVIVDPYSVNRPDLFSCNSN